MPYPSQYWVVEELTSWWSVALFRPTQKCEWALLGPVYETVIYFIF